MIEFVVAQRLLAGANGDVVRSARDLRAEPVEDRRLLVERHARGLEVAEQRCRFRGQQQRQRRERLVRRGGEPLQQRLEMPQQRVHRLVAVAVAVEGEQ